MWRPFPTGINYARQALVVAAILVASGLILVVLGLLLWWAIFCSLLGLVYVILALHRLFQIEEQKG